MSETRDGGGERVGPGTDSHSVVQNDSLRFRWALLMAVLALIARPLDERAVDLLNPDAPRPGLDALAIWFEAWSTRLEVAFIFCGLLLAFLVGRLASLRVAFLTGALGWLGTELVVGVLKRAVRRPRPLHPEAALEFLRPLYDRPDLKSFPSGHAATAVFFAVLVALLTRSRAARAAAAILALLVMADRLYMGAHYLSDVLAGGAIGWGALVLCQRVVSLYRASILAAREPRRLAGLTVLAFLVAGGWILQAPPELRDALTGEILESHRLPGPTLATVLLEPLRGPALRVAAMADLKSFAVHAILWLALGVGLSILVMRRRALPWLAGVFVMLAIWGSAAIAGLAGDRQPPRAREGGGETIVVDLQSHLGDPVDGGITLDDGLARFRRLGYDLVVPTWHNAWSQGRLLQGGAAEPIDLWGLEWSDGAPWESPLHLLVFNRRPEPADLVEVRDWRELVRRVHEAGGLVLGSHFWRGDRERMPSAEELVAAGIDGFEVAGRNQEIAREPKERLEEIRALCRRHRLAATASSDFHGARSGNYCWNLVASDGESPADAVWRALAERRESLLPVVLDSPLDVDLGPLMPAAVALSYFRELGLAGRASWFLWIAAAVAVIRLVARRRAGSAARP